MRILIDIGHPAHVHFYKNAIRQLESELFQEAEVRSLNNFERLENVLVITNFQPVDLSVFEDAEETP